MSAEDTIDLALVGGDDALEDRHGHVGPPGAVDDGPQVLGQARATERKARTKVSRRDVELRVRGEDVHHGVTVEPKGLADRADLVGEAGFQGMEAVVGVLDHLGDGQRYTVDGAGQALVELGDSIAARLVELADHRLGRVEKVMYRAALAQELGVHRETEVHSCAHARGGFEAREHDLLARRRQHRGADDDGVSLLAAGQRRSDLLADLLEVAGQQAPARGRRRADAHQRDVGVGHGACASRSSRSAALGDLLSDEVADAFLDHRAPPLVDHRDLLGADVDADDDVSAARQASRGDTPT